MFRLCWVIFREKLSVVVTLSLHYTIERECAVDCALRRLWRRELFVVSACTVQAVQAETTKSSNGKFLPEDDPAESKHVGVCYN
jgi:hypothetical protein